ncbi:MAG: transposase, partial [Porphyromonas sp.]|uniref:transposase n=1 Tax=Porphyromonas sp. TaxID=1924944 RepID=UPI002A919510
KKIRVPIFKESNVGSRMAIDEKTIDGVCYTIISNRETSKIALMADTPRTSELRQVLSRFSVKTMMKVNSVRIRHRQAILALERKKNKTVQEQLTLQEKFANEDTLKQPLHRSKGLLFKRKKEWTDDQKERAKILFKQFPEIEEAYKYCLRIRKWYEPIRPRSSDRKYKIKEADLMLITKEGMESEVEEIRNVANFLRSNSTQILRYFYRRESNAKAEALNQNLRRFVSVNYGARNTDFFHYRISLHIS